MRSPSSLIFIVLLGVWAAYFLQFWIRRRDHLATARSVEQFSAAMRVLERRTAIPRTDLSDPTPRSWSVHPARTARPQVVVKRAVPAAGAPGVLAPHVAEGPVPMSALSSSSSSSPAAPRRASTPTPARVRPGRRVRALTLLATLVATVVVTGLAAFSLVVPVWSPAVGLAAIVVALAWVRSGVRAEQAARAARRRRTAQETRRRAAAAPVVAHRQPAARSAARPGTAAQAAPEPEVAVHDESSSDMAAAVSVADPQVAEAPVAESPAAAAPLAEPVPEPAPEPAPETRIEYVHLVDEDDIPLTWEPVPVPRPTYTMKAKAERPAVAPAAVTPDPAPVETPLRSAEDDLDVRRAAGA